MARFKVVQVANDGYAVPDWVAPQLAQAGIDFSIADCWNQDDLARHAADADLVWVFGGRRVLVGDNLLALARCRAIVRTGSGTDNIDIKRATELGIVVANTPQVPVDSVSDQAISLLFALVRQIARHDRLIRRGEWNFRLAPPARRFQKATLGLIGFGRIAQQVLHKLAGFDMRFVAHDPFTTPEVMSARGVVGVSLDELLRVADYVSVHCPLTPETLHLLGEREFRLMKPGAILVNTARGPIVDEQALVKALQEGWLAGAGLDVLEKEPPDPDNPLLQMENVILTPHLGGNSDRFPEDFFEASVEAILDLAAGRRPYSVVNPEVRRTGV
jgi:D-3-phosphoglycerate dehydrogenase / 2-oxoglutarate reductase